MSLTVYQKVHNKKMGIGQNDSIKFWLKKKKGCGEWPGVNSYNQVPSSLQQHISPHPSPLRLGLYKPFTLICATILLEVLSNVLSDVVFSEPCSPLLFQADLISYFPLIAENETTDSTSPFTSSLQPQHWFHQHQGRGECCSKLQEANVALKILLASKLEKSLSDNSFLLSPCYQLSMRTGLEIQNYITRSLSY